MPEDDHRGTRTPQFLIRSQTPYPLGHAATADNFNRKLFKSQTLKQRFILSCIIYLRNPVNFRMFKTFSRFKNCLQLFKKSMRFNFFFFF